MSLSSPIWCDGKCHARAFDTALTTLPPATASSFVVVGAHNFGAVGSRGRGEANDPSWLVKLARERPWAAILLIEASPLIAKDLNPHRDDGSSPELARWHRSGFSAADCVCCGCARGGSFTGCYTGSTCTCCGEGRCNAYCTWRSAERRVARAPFHNDSRVIISNVAICPKRMAGDAPTLLPFYTVAARLLSGDASLPAITDQFGSLDRSQVEKQLPDILKAMEPRVGTRHVAGPRQHNWTLEALNSTIRAHSVPCRTLGDELRRHRLPPPAVVYMDIEGLDCEVVSELDGCTIAPQVLQFEHAWCRRAAYDDAVRSVREKRCGEASLRYGQATHPRWSDVAFYRHAE